MNELFSKDIAVYLDASATDTPDWKLAVCIKSTGLSITVDSVTLNNHCTDDFVRNLPSTASWTMSFEGDTNTSPGVNEVSTNDLFAVATTRAVKKWKFESGDMSYVRYGEAFISQMDETASDPEYQAFSITLSGSGAILDAEPT